MLISWMIFTKLFYPKQIKNFKNELSVNPNNREDYSKSVIKNILWFSILCIFIIMNVVPAIVISNECNKGNPWHLVLSFLFSDVYVLHYTVRKFIYKDNYCNI